MKQLLYGFALASLMMLLSAPCYGATEITLDHIDGLFGSDTVFAGDTVRFVHRLTYTPGDGSAIICFTNGFKVWTHRNGAYTNSFAPIEFDSLPLNWRDLYEAFGIYSHGVDGVGTDTAAFFGCGAMVCSGIVDGFDQPVWWIETTPFQDGDTLCLDSSCYPPNGEWLWSTTSFLGNFPPDWYGPSAFTLSNAVSAAEETWTCEEA